MNRDELTAHIEAVEKSYEFFLAYAAQGAQSDEASKVGGQLRQFLADIGGALDALAADLGSIVETEGLEPADRYRAMTDIASADAARAAAQSGSRGLSLAKILLPQIFTTRSFGEETAASRADRLRTAARRSLPLITPLTPF